MRVSKVISIIVYILIAVVLLGVVGLFIGYLSNGQKSFYIQSGSNKIYKDQETFEFSETEYNIFYVKNSLGFTDEQASDMDYSVKVVLCPTKFAEQDFTSYIVDDHSYSLVELDITDYFDILQEGDRFLFKLNSSLTLNLLLGNYHNVATIENLPQIDLYSDTYLSLVVFNNADDSVIKMGIVRGI
ncbi:MAG: hypothetical protein K2L70_04530 [Clostridia bacterium]|nr:hypothetical protein [Clostridia bacterium]